MRHAWFFFSILMIGLLFEISKPIQHNFFPNRLNWFSFYDYPMYLSSLVYYLSEHLIAILFGAYIAYMFYRILKGRAAVSELRNAIPFAIIYTVLEGLDAVDFVFTGNTEWFQIWGWPITFNAIKVFIFILSMSYTYAGRVNS